jgi:protease-4
MNTETTPTKKKRSFYDILKYIMIILVILQFAPSVISKMSHSIYEGVAPTSKVGYLKISGSIDDSAFYIKRLKDFEKTDSIKGLLIKIDSPGGFPGSSQAIAQEIRKFKTKKPVVVYVENVCASAAYYIACEANKILATPSSMIGSIGVVMQLPPNVKGFLDNWSVKMNHIQSGIYKTAGSPTKDMSEIEEKYLQDLTNSAYEQFVADVALARGLDEKTQSTWAEGKIFTGTQALNLKLIDKLGSYSDALDMIKELTGITGEVHLVAFKKRPSGIMPLLIGDEDYGTESSMSSRTAQFLFGVYKNFLLQLSAEQKSMIV